MTRGINPGTRGSVVRSDGRQGRGCPSPSILEKSQRADKAQTLSHSSTLARVGVTPRKTVALSRHPTI